MIESKNLGYESNSVLEERDRLYTEKSKKSESNGELVSEDYPDIEYEMLEAANTLMSLRYYYEKPTDSS
ncbi:hypothetical protein INT48_009904 [Thamnidium elegans]|uniref:Uncharacterized protein n=1 Tax=Thamnidium elegans TaxID=101142 RepID=A0A8H7SHM0_9FUNG|nr:hypothetical protein INT48_009904 [Thamnidium elegans]